MKRFIPILIFVLPFLYLVLDVPDPVIGKDSGDYNSYAINLVQGRGYSIDGTGFDNAREPGYPLFLAAVYSVAGVGNIEAVIISQILLLGLLGWIVYAFFARLGRDKLGLAAGFLVTLLPSYALYTHVVGSELLFALLVAASLYVTLRIHTEPDKTWLYPVLGLLLGYGSLVRLQLLFMLPFLIIFCVIFARNYLKVGTLRNVVLALACFAVVVGAWMGVVYVHTGGVDLTSSERIDTSVYIRAARAELSYSNNLRYGLDWIRRSLSGGVGTSFLKDNDYHTLTLRYRTIAPAEDASAVELQRARDEQTILANPGHYLFGNLVELVKLNYIEHDFSDYLNRYVRAGQYLVIYVLFLFGLFKTYRATPGPLKSAALLAFLFILYNWLVITPFDVIPRYNTPYLFAYLIIGFIGFAYHNKSTHEGAVA